MIDRNIEVLVTIGTDYHPFPRLVRWIDDWLEEHPHMAVKVLVQHGATEPSVHAFNTQFLAFDELAQLMRAATAVVVHGGPATIFEARSQGHIPICIPRDPRQGEIVDNHQQRFAHRLTQENLILLVEDDATFKTTLDRVLAEPETASVTIDDQRLLDTALRFKVLTQNVAIRSRATARRGRKSAG